MALSDELKRRIGKSTKKGTKITSSLVGKVKADEEGVKIIEDNTEEIVQEIGTAILRALYEVGLAAETHAKLLCPVDTGRLRNSITFVIDQYKEEVYIGTNVEYAKDQESGRHAANGGRGFLRPAATDYITEYQKIFEDALKNA